MSFTSARLAEFNALRNPNMFGVALTRNGVSVYVISTPIVEAKKITTGPFLLQRDSMIDMERTEWEDLEMGVDALFEMNGITFQVQDGVKDDPAEPTVQFKATKKK